ncbi:MAG: hypothetical protein JJT75_15145 [Opitutales bacterium]|nr:hypothetical protein [Opitutales bacterium]
MRFRYGNWLHEPNEAVFNLRYSGAQINQPAEFLRVAKAAFFARGNRSHSLSFTVDRHFDTQTEATEFYFAGFGSLPQQDDLICRVEDGPGSTKDIQFGQTVLESIEPVLVGQSVSVTFTFSTPGTTDIATLPSTLIIDMYSGSATIPSGVSTVPVSGLSLPGKPDRILATVSRPGSGGANIFATVDANSITADGFTARLSGLTPDANHTLDWVAIYNS